MAEMKLGRPKKEMMRAVNALIAKDKSAADELAPRTNSIEMSWNVGSTRGMANPTA